MDQQRIPCTILIKRRVTGEPGPPSFLSNGELAFNEGNQTLFIGTESQTLSSDTQNE